MNFINFSCLIFVLKCAITPKPKNIQGGKRPLIVYYSQLSFFYHLEEPYIDQNKFLNTHYTFQKHYHTQLLFFLSRAFFLWLRQLFDSL